MYGLAALLISSLFAGFAGGIAAGPPPARVVLVVYPAPTGTQAAGSGDRLRVGIRNVGRDPVVVARPSTESNLFLAGTPGTRTFPVLTGEPSVGPDNFITLFPGEEISIAVSLAEVARHFSIRTDRPFRFEYSGGFEAGIARERGWHSNVFSADVKSRVLGARTARRTAPGSRRGPGS
jgi:hypothetical protein